MTEDLERLPYLGCQLIRVRAARISRIHKLGSGPGVHPQRADLVRCAIRVPSNG